LGESLGGKREMRLWMSGVELGVYMFAGYAMQAIGLQYTSASRSAFLLYLNVKLVPMFGCLRID
jgi:drug/metabolite transporter (DMT)-like permease